MGEAQLLNKGIDAIVVALCADYLRRREALSKRSVSHSVEMEYKYLNYKIFTAAAEIVGEEDAETYVKEIGERIGYANTVASECCERIYKVRKLAVKRNIAKRLWLCD